MSRDKDTRGEERRRKRVKDQDHADAIRDGMDNMDDDAEFAWDESHRNRGRTYDRRLSEGFGMLADD